MFGREGGADVLRGYRTRGISFQCVVGDAMDSLLRSTAAPNRPSAGGSLLHKHATQPCRKLTMFRYNNYISGSTEELPPMCSRHPRTRRSSCDDSNPRSRRPNQTYISLSKLNQKMERSRWDGKRSRCQCRLFRFAITGQVPCPVPLQEPVKLDPPPPRGP